jgi:hypothetical protein
MGIAIGNIGTRANVDSNPLNSIFTTYGNEINRVGGIVDAATVGGAASQLLKLDSNGIATVQAVSVLSTNPAGNSLYLRAAATPTVPVELVQNHAASSNLRTLDGSGNGVYLGTVTAAGFDGPLTGNASTATTAATATTATTAGALTVPVPITGVASDYKIIPSGVAGTVNVSAGAAYGDGINRVPSSAPVSVPLPTQPTGTNIQFILISKQPITGAPRTTSSTPSATGLPVPQYPQGDIYLGMVTWRYNTPGGIVPAADIDDGRFPGAGGGSSSGTGGAPATAAYATIGAPPGALSGAKDITSSATTGVRIAPALIGGDANSPGADQIFNDFVQRDTFTANRMNVSGGTVNIVAASNNKWTVGAGGVARQISATISATVPGGTAAGAILFLIVDTSPSPPTLALSTSSSGLSSTQKVLTAFVWDGATLARPDTGYLAAAMSTAVSLGERISATDTGSNGVTTLTTSIQQFANFNSTSFRLTEQCVLVGNLHVVFDVTIAASDAVYVLPLLDGGTILSPAAGARIYRQKYLASATEVYLDIPFISQPVPAGVAHTLSAGAFRVATGATTITAYGNFCEIVAVPWRA